MAATSQTRRSRTWRSGRKTCQIGGSHWKRFHVTRCHRYDVF